MLLFKYLDPIGTTKVLEHDKTLSLRFGLPRGYNDPYELFLQPSEPIVDEEQRAFYDFFLGQVIQAPVSCFSKRPDSIPMWAHYAKEGTGVVIGIDEDALSNEFSLAYFADVDYSDKPATIASSIINHAFTTGKRRHSLRLLAIAHRSAFFIKRTEWHYEQERRLVVPNDEVIEEDGILLKSTIRPAVLRFIIVGARADADLRALSSSEASDDGRKMTAVDLAPIVRVVPATGPVVMLLSTYLVRLSARVSAIRKLMKRSDQTSN